VKLWEIALILLGIDVLAIAAMLEIRRRAAPAGSFYKETQLAAGVLSVTGTIFAVLVGFVFLLAFQSYERARSSSQDEAVAALGLFHLANQFPAGTERDLQDDVVCYGGAVIASEWPAMADGHSSPLVDGWLSRIARRFASVSERRPREVAAAQDWFTETDSLQQARRGRLAEAPRVVPGTIWVLLIAVGAVVLVFVLLFADPRELRVSQLVMIAAVTTGVVASLLTVNFLDRPYGNHAGAITPTAMRAAETSMQREQAVRGLRPTQPCDLSGNPMKAG
jgi:hypothetical protein